MKKSYKYIIISFTLLFITLLLVTFKIYYDFKATVEELYTPLQTETLENTSQSLDLEKLQPLSILLLGIDEQDNETGRSDTIIVLTVNPILETTKLLSIPRDTYTEIIGRGNHDKINHAYSFGGIEMAVQTVEHLLDIPIDYVATVNLNSFIELIDIVGPIRVENNFAFQYGGDAFPLGEVTLNGKEALNFVRMRYEDPKGDFGRQNRQKQVIQGVFTAMASVDTVFKYPAILDIAAKNIVTNFDFSQLIPLYKYYSKSLQNIEQLYLINGVDMRVNHIYYYQLDEQELQQVRQQLQEHLQS